MPEYVRVRDNGTKHEYSVVASAVDPAAQTVLKEDAVDEIGVPLPPKHHAPKTAPSESLSSNTESGQTAAIKKE
jgi:hypothetical protein